MSNNNDQGSTMGGFFSGLLWGALSGIALGLLYAPDKGEKTRKKLQKEYGNWRNQAEGYREELERFRAEKLPEFRDRLTKKQEEFEGRARKAASRAKGEVKKAKETVEKRLADRQLNKSDE